MPKTPHSKVVAAQKSTTVAALLKQLPPERASELAQVRSVILAHLPSGYEEVVCNGMIVYQVPTARYGDTYNGQPLWLAAMAAPKSYLTLHLMPVYGSPSLLKALAEGFQRAGKRLDIGKACIHFRRAEDLALDAIGQVVALMPVDKWVAIAESRRRR